MSYVATTTLINTVTTDAAFRTWGSAYSAKLASMGWVQTSDTGQINWTTVLSSLVVNTVQGYEIWRMNDALQSTAPIFLKLEFGNGNPVANPSFWIQLGSGSNGTGGLTGILSVRHQVTWTASVAATTHYWSGDTNRLAIVNIGTTVANSHITTIERTVDAAGVVTTEGALLLSLSIIGSRQLAWNQTTGNCTAAWETTFGSMGPALAPFGVFGAQLAVYPIYHNKGIFLNPGLNGLMYENLTIAAFSPITFTHYGAFHTYMPLGVITNVGGRGGFSAVCLMIRYE